nr:tyrosine-type recombinase/integrase [Natronosalvus amylolyticus]
MDAFEAVRNRALITVIAYTGVRGSEILADYRDDRRVGLRWHAVDLENGTIRVLGKSQETEDVGLTGQTIKPLHQLRRIIDPPSEGWPVFPSRHPPSLYKRIEEEGYDKPDGDPWDFMLENDIEPPAMSTSGTRTLFKRLSKEADVPGLDLEAGEYLTLHGARRGVGEALYREHGAQRAQRTLRHADPKTTSKMYSHIEASELGEDNTAVFERE